VHLGVVDAEALDLDHDFARLRQWFGDVGVDQAVQSTELL
jgi:hypothetical protein